MNIGIIGAGQIGEKRAANMKGAKLVAVCDSVPERADALAKKFGGSAEKSADALIMRPDVHAVIVCTTHDHLAGFGAAAVKAGKHVLVEKPGGRHPGDAKILADAARSSRSIVRVGFNHRFHPAFQKASTILKSGRLGPLMYIRARYGHGGRVGYEKEWRADAAISGGGELLDQGIHLIDLCRWLGGDFNLEWGKTKTFFWPMKVEDNGFLYMESPDHKRSAFLHASWTEWKNLFDFEIFARNGKLEIWGLGRSYRAEELRIYQMKPEMGPPEIEIIHFPGDDISWQAEFDAFMGAISGKANDLATADDALHALDIVDAAYHQNEKAGTR